MDVSRIPEYQTPTFAGMRAWFKAMAKRGLIFHPDDPPATLFSIRTGERFFTQDECLKLDPIMNRMFRRFGDRVYEAAYPVFMRVFRNSIKR